MGRFGGRFDERPGAEDTSADAKRDRVLAHFPPAMVPRAMALITPAQPGRDRCRFSFLADAATGRVALSFAERGAGAAPVDGHALASRRVNDLLPLIVAAANARAPLRASLRAAHVHAPRWAGARAGQESEIPNFKGSYLGHFPLVSADFWTSDHLSDWSRSVDAFSGTRARGTLTLKRR